MAEEAASGIGMLCSGVSPSPSAYSAGDDLLLGPLLITAHTRTRHLVVWIKEGNGHTCVQSGAEKPAHNYLQYAGMNPQRKDTIHSFWEGQETSQRRMTVEGGWLPHKP